MKKGFRYALFATAILLLASCSATKYVPEGSYLLDEVRIQTDNREIKPSSLSMYVRQNPNSKWFSLIKTQLQIPLNRVHFLDLPFYETGKIEKNPISEADVEIVLQLLRDVKPHQIYVAGDLADPHGTHRVCTDAVLAAIDIEKEAGAEWLKDCRIWMYRGAWAEWEIENIEMAVPFSPEELRAKRNSILKHQSQMESAPFLGNDERLFWQRSEDRNRGTAALYDQLGLACYEAMEAFVEYVPL